MTSDGQISLFGGRAQTAGPSAEAGPPDGAAARAPAAPTPARPGDSPETAVPVSGLNAAARATLEQSFRPLWVGGEVANWTRAASGHRYFTLRDETAQISCVMWRSDAERLPADPEEGMEICGYGQVSLYEARGTYQLLVRKLEARGEGLWRLAFERLRARLAAEGLLDPERKRALPRVPETVGVVTSRSGAALRDVLAVVRRRAPWTRILVADCRVQGEGAAAEIVAALGRLIREGTSEVIVLTRGGGSVEDLWAFNEEAVARAIAACPIPTVSAVGHEVDVTIADLVADRRAPTPSAAAELVVPDGVALRSRLGALAGGLVAGLRGRIERGERRARDARRALDREMERRLKDLAARLGQLGGRLEALSPLGTLRRGYAVPLDGSGRVLRGLEAFEKGVRFDLRVVDGLVECRTERTKRLEEAE